MVKHALKIILIVNIKVFKVCLTFFKFYVKNIKSSDVNKTVKKAVLEKN